MHCECPPGYEIGPHDNYTCVGKSCFDIRKRALTLGKGQFLKMFLFWCRY
jgi:hypothetical protein